MKLYIFSIFWLCFSSIVRASPDPITHTFLSLLKDSARKTTPSKNDFAIINQLKNLDLKQLSHKKGGNTRSGELNHQTSGPRPQVLVKNGHVIGETISGSHAFYSVPYGKPPVGPLR